MSRSKHTARSVAFSFRAPDAESVFLAGSFNSWSAAALAMHKDASGDRSVSLTLKPGRYEYKFVVDGDWHSTAAGASDTDRFECVPNAFGTENRVLEVS